MVFVLAVGCSAARAETIRVTIKGLGFSPAQTQAKVGDTIEWINEDFVAHTATVRGEWDMMVPVHKSASLVLKRAGTVEYYCRFHPNMKGSIAVAPE
ncbi:MAG TPA: cupredoxin domain-containing protein [Aliidongia sp.]|uniref:cupredoxin domain-containing protein n=1 Tax=Aliidongia sp. TaxID=1914230 RepID=UPI002DDCC01A|nr:cupredoxin domain-containing protein [Aliidongia sp.]HEV2677021.1 cupredoxin domain-containing protein [Aliidongia sp.]